MCKYLYINIYIYKNVKKKFTSHISQQLTINHKTGNLIHYSSHKMLLQRGGRGDVPFLFTRVCWGAQGVTVMERRTMEPWKCEF
ncbi:hypothetical protein GDO81_009453 [Engystomops pustulosus]|uniref:Uncharacterized protein n=1 Tax=Engystomops pustulosus TaxID=76066 RepID=A0AAV7BS44_ENGPU|nr:hypothetical protein GDO81_009453 [Engystomops pustulosus]